MKIYQKHIPAQNLTIEVHNRCIEVMESNNYIDGKVHRLNICSGESNITEPHIARLKEYIKDTNNRLLLCAILGTENELCASVKDGQWSDQMRIRVLSKYSYGPKHM